MYTASNMLRKVQFGSAALLVGYIFTYTCKQIIYRNETTIEKCIHIFGCSNKLGELMSYVHEK